MPNPEISYFTNEASSPFPTILVIAPNGSATLTVGTNRDNPDQEIVGIFKKHLEDREIASFVSALRSPEFMSIRNPDSALPGEPVHKITIKEKDHAAVIKWIGFHSPAPSSFLAIEKQALSLVSSVRQKPFQAISMRMSHLPDSPERDKPVELSISIVNSGTETIQVHHTKSWAANNDHMKLVGLRSDISLDELEEYHQRFEELSEGQIKNIEELNLSKPLISLVHNGRLVLAFKVKLDWPPGRYNVKTESTLSLLDKEGVEQIVCELFSKDQDVKILGASKPGDESEDTNKNEDDDFGGENLSNNEDN